MKSIGDRMEWILGMYSVSQEVIYLASYLIRLMLCAVSPSPWVIVYNFAFQV